MPTRTIIRKRKRKRKATRIRALLRLEEGFCCLLPAMCGLLTAAVACCLLLARCLPSRGEICISLQLAACDLQPSTLMQLCGCFHRFHHTQTKAHKFAEYAAC
mmetsp:Transcript_3435/g.6562  ORF Transcript_3435/g.6562 Transcript_3435/m.6562 type:complete len:103 (+) Transcript_3435:70-378(+)